MTLLRSSMKIFKRDKVQTTNTLKTSPDETKSESTTAGSARAENESGTGKSRAGSGRGWPPPFYGSPPPPPKTAPPRPK